MNTKWNFKWKSPALKSKRDFNAPDVNEIMKKSIYDLWYEYFNISGDYAEITTYQRVMRWTLEYIGYHLNYFKCNRLYWIHVIHECSEDYLIHDGCDAVPIDDLFNLLELVIK